MSSARPRAFVVHGHNELARLELCEILSSEFGFEPVVLKQEAALGRTIIESFEAHVSESVVAFVLLTGDDRVISEGQEALRSRQNVIFELGYLCCGLGRRRVCVVYQEGVELPSDLLGILYCSFKTSVREAQPALTRHLRELGLAPMARRTPALLVVDDDLSSDSELARLLQRLFAGRANVEVLSDPQEACAMLASQQGIVGCITDIVFRRHSQLAGVQVAETAMNSGVPVVVFTGHSRRHIGIALGELARLGLPEDRVIAKPVKVREYRQFLDVVKRCLLGAGG